jgi:hypothetical protein
VPQNTEEETRISTRNLNKPSFNLPSYLEHSKNRFTQKRGLLLQELRRLLPNAAA